MEILERFRNKSFNTLSYDLLHHDLNVPYVRDEIKRLSQRHADRMEEHPNMVATNFMKKSHNNRLIKKKTTSRLM